MSWTLIVGSGLFFVLYAIFRDMPPFVYYLLTIPLGIALLKASTS